MFTELDPHQVSTALHNAYRKRLYVKTTWASKGYFWNQFTLLKHALLSVLALNCECAAPGDKSTLDFSEEWFSVVCTCTGERCKIRAKKSNSGLAWWQEPVLRALEFRDGDRHQPKLRASLLYIVKSCLEKKVSVKIQYCHLTSFPLIYGIK